MGRAPCCDERLALKKGPWTPDEDQKLVAYIQAQGHGNWRALPEKAGLARCGKSCRLRWTNYLRPDIKRGRFSLAEDETIIQLHAVLGNRWSAIASHLPRRTDNEIKNYWNTHLKKRLTQMGIDPVTHNPASPLLATPLPGPLHWTPLTSTRLTHRTQWELTLAEAHARLNPNPPHPTAAFLRSWNPKTEPPSLPFPPPIQAPLLSQFPEISYNPSTVYDGVAMENLFSPTSILQGPEYSDSSSASGNFHTKNADFQTKNADCFSSFGSFPIIEDSPSMSDDIFWEAAEDIDVTDHSAGVAGGLELMAPLQLDVDDQVFSLPFGSSSLCHGGASSQ